MLVVSIFSFSCDVVCPVKDIFSVLTFNLLSAIAFNLDQAKILLSGKGLRLSGISDTLM